ncbi:SusC/RagA family TonB-linked outer membrane protein [Larkinella soli]|uniref:SusC/RagA family TonB-linked outer membrane protein n=1 Tax=Larkinella soli TaxID=1770527 RepID=UPI000FFC8E89|nr:TonB-dependent receptor [Larkinella soli]
MINPPNARSLPGFWSTTHRLFAGCWIAFLATQVTPTAASPPPPADSLATREGRLTTYRITGAADSIPGRKLNRILTGNPLQALQGQAAGVLVTANSGDPGGAVSVQVRGPGRFGDSSPLIVVDGMVIGQEDNLNWLSPNDIETVEVLKDAASSAVYGMRAANGVVLITTKRGRAGKPRVTVGLSAGVQRMTRRPDLLNTQQYIDFINESRSNGGLISAFKLTNQQSLDTLRGTNTNWVGEIIRPAAVRNAYVSVAGGNETSRYQLSVDYFKQQGLLLSTDFERLGLRLNTEFDLTDRLKVGEHLTAGQSVRHANEGMGGRTPLEQALKSAPYLSVTNPRLAGGFNGPTYLDAGNDARNPVGQSKLFNDRRTQLNLIGDLYGEWAILDGLTYRATFGFDLRNFDRLFSMPAYNMGEFDINPSAAVVRAKQSRYNLLLSHQLTYSYATGGHSVTALLSGSRQTYRTDDISASADGLPGNNILALTAGQSSRNRAVGGVYGFYRIVSLLGQVSYDYRKTYFLGAAIRRDGSSRFGPGNRFGTFPSVSAAWYLHREAFLASVPYLTTVKLRAGWGKTGNDNVGDFRYASLIAENYNYPFGPTNSFLGLGALPGTLPNPGVRWESSAMANLGLDLGAFENSVRVSLDYFRKRTSDLLVEVPLPSSVGAAAPLTNAGQVETRGLDLSLYVERTWNWLTYGLSGFASWQRNEVKSLGERPDPVFSGTVEGETVTATASGHPVGSYYGFQVAGIYQNRDEIRQNPGLPGTEPGDLRYADLNGDGKITDDDKTWLGSPVPTFYYGLSANVSGKGFDLAALLQGVTGNDLYNASAYWLNGYLGRYNAGTQVLNRWTRERSSTAQPRADASGTNNFRPSTRFVENGGYLRLKMLQLGYTLPESLTSSWGISRLRVYVGGQNLFTKTRYSGLDPEFAANQAIAEGIDVSVVPQPRTFLGGIQLSF